MILRVRRHIMGAFSFAEVAQKAPCQSKGGWQGPRNGIVSPEAFPTVLLVERPYCALKL